MEFDYYLIVLKKEGRFGIKGYKLEFDGTEKWVDVYGGYQKPTLFQSLHQAEKQRKLLPNKDDTYIKAIKIEF